MSETFEQRTDRRLTHMEQRIEDIAEQTSGIPALINRVLELMGDFRHHTHETGGPIVDGQDFMSVGYTRVSTEAQLDGYGLDIQAGAIVALAQAEGLTVTATFTDGGISGTKDADERPGLDALVQHCTDNPGTTVLLPKLDRLARALAIQEHVLATLWATGATVLSCDAGENHYLRTGDDPDDPTRTLIRQVLGAVAQFERGQISLRLRKGRRHKIAEHGWAGGVEPYGWSDPREQQVIADTLAIRANRVPWRMVCVTLTNRGDFKRNGKPWNETELCRVVRRARQRPGGNHPSEGGAGVLLTLV